MKHAGDERRYVRAVESAWFKVLGRTAVVSPREFETIDAWRRRGIPLSVVLEAIESAGKRRSGRTPRSLTALSQAIADAWAVVSAGRATPGISEALPARADARRAWEEALARSPERGRLRALLTTLLAGQARGDSAEALDAALDAALVEAVPEPERRHANDETARALLSFRGRMSEDEFRKMFARALVDRLRSRLALPRLALTR